MTRRPEWFVHCRALTLDQFAGAFPRSASARWARLFEEQGLVEWSNGQLIGSVHALQLTGRGALKTSRVFDNPVRELPPA